MTDVTVEEEDEMYDDLPEAKLLLLLFEMLLDCWLLNATEQKLLLLSSATEAADSWPPPINLEARYVLSCVSDSWTDGVMDLLMSKAAAAGATVVSDLVMVSFQMSS